MLGAALLPQISQVRFWRIQSAQVSSSLLQWIRGAGLQLLLPQISQVLKVLEDPACYRLAPAMEGGAEGSRGSSLFRLAQVV